MFSVSNGFKIHDLVESGVEVHPLVEFAGLIRSREGPRGVTLK